VSYRLKVLHQEMLHLPIEERRIRWEEYYRRLGVLVKLQDDIEQAMTALLFDQASSSPPK